jgi:hypothetical protein
MFCLKSPAFVVQSTHRTQLGIRWQFDDDTIHTTDEKDTFIWWMRRRRKKKVTRRKYWAHLTSTKVAT